MAVKPAKAIADLLARKQILKVDKENNILFKVSGSLGTGSVSSSLPVTASGYFSAFDSFISGTLTTKNLAISDEKSYVNINQLSNVSASDAQEGEYLVFSGSNWVPSSVRGVGITKETYNRVRYTVSGTFDGKDVIEIALPLSSSIRGPAFTPQSINQINFTLLVQETSESNWKNDLASVEFKLSGVVEQQIYALISAPSLPYAYSFNAVNLNPEVVNSSIMLGEYSTLIVEDDAYVSGSLYTSASSNLPNIGNINLLSGSFYNVDNVFTSIDNRFAQLVTNFNNLREIVTGSFDFNGDKIVTLNNFIALDIDYLSLDVMVKYSGSTQYVNDLISVRMSGTLSNQINVEISAPSVTHEDFYRIIAVKETGSI
jgi:hypothetical protein